MILKKAGVFLVLFIILVSAPVFAYNSPGLPIGFVNDFASIISSETISKIEKKLSDFEKNNGTEIVVVTVPSLDDDVIENYAVELFQDWGIGKNGKDNGVLLLVAQSEHKVRIEVGYGLEGDLTDLVSNTIIRNDIIPRFKEEDFSKGIENGVESIMQVVQGIYVSEATNEKPKLTTSQTILDIIFFIIFFVLWIAGAVGRKLGSSKAIWPGGILGAIFGIAISLLLGLGTVFLGAVFVSAVVGLLLDWFLSRTGHGQDFTKWLNTKHKNGRGGGFFGGFGGRSGGGFGGFGGGGSGGGGSSGSW